MASVNGQISTFVFLDLESTGFLSARDKTRITECSMVAVHRTQLLDAYMNKMPCPPRALNKLTLCFYPWKPMTHEIWKLTGLDNDNLYHQMHFNEGATKILNDFLARLAPPVCLFAHHGDMFDFPLLKTETDNSGHSLNDDILCVDTLKMLRAIYGVGGYARKQSAARTPIVNRTLTPDGCESLKTTQELSEKTPEKPTQSATYQNVQDPAPVKMTKMFKTNSGISVKRKLFPETNPVTPVGTTCAPQPKQNCSGVNNEELDWGCDVEDDSLVNALNEYEEMEQALSCSQPDESECSQNSCSILTGKIIPVVKETRLPPPPQHTGNGTLLNECGNGLSHQPNHVLKSLKDDPPKSFKLSAVFEHLFGIPPAESHTAESDCMSLLMICQKMAPLVCELADEHAIPFSSFSAVYTLTSKSTLNPGQFPYELDLLAQK